MGKCRGLGKNGKCSVKNQSEFGTTIGNVEKCYYLCVAPSKEYTRLKGIAYYHMQQNNLFISEKPSELMAQNQSALLDAEVFLNDNYDLRRNVLSGKTEVRKIVRKKVAHEQPWQILTAECANSIVLHAKREGIGDARSPRQDIMEYLASTEIPEFNPIADFLSHLPEWDGNDHVARLFGRIPGMGDEKKQWCHIWMLSAVAHWLQMEKQHGNETVPVLIGSQGCGKSTFAYRLLPPELRQYYLDHINFGNKFDSEMALTHNLLVNIDEFANMGASQQGKLKQTLSKVKVNGRPIFGRSQEDRPRFASFLATTNDRHPLCDGTGSRRYICISVPVGCNIDNDSPIDYSQLYAQLRQELADGRRYWFNNDEVALIQKANQPYYKVSDVEQILFSCFRLPEEQEEGQWFRGSEITELLSVHYPELRVSHTLQINIGKTLRALGCEVKHTKIGQAYQLVALKALKSIA